MSLDNFLAEFTNVDFVLDVTILLICTCSIINTTEELFLFLDKRSKHFFDWDVLGLRPFFMKNKVAKKINTVLLSNQSYPVVLAVKLISSIGILFSYNYFEIQRIFILLLLVSTYLAYYRNIFGQDGSDQMFTIVITCTAIIFLFRENSFIVNLSIYFIAFQVTLAYFVAGVSKTFGESWRKGTAIYGITNTLSFGSSTFVNILHKNKYLSILMTWIVISWEIAFPIVFIGNSYIVVIMLVIGLVFHLMNSEIMGLNSFFFAFLATYPSLIYSIHQIN